AAVEIDMRARVCLVCFAGPLLALVACAAEPLPPEVIARVGSSRLRPGVSPGALVYAPDGKSLAVATYLDGITLWDTTTGELRRRMAARQNQSIFYLHFSRDGKVLSACGHLSTPGTMPSPVYARYDAETGRELAKHLPKDGNLSFVITSRDGKTAALG